MFSIDNYILVVTCWVYSLRWDRTGLSSIIVLSFVTLAISARLWLNILQQMRLRLLRIYFHLRGVKVSDHLKKKAKMHQPKSSQVLPLNVVTEEIEELEESENGKAKNKAPKQV